MSKRPTNDLFAAVQRLRAAAPFLICADAHKYGGSIWSDLEAVFRVLDALDDAEYAKPEAGKQR